jgi:hypothetical protein
MESAFYTLNKENFPHHCEYIEAEDVNSELLSYSSGHEMSSAHCKMKRYHVEVVESIFAEPKSAERFIKKYNKLPLTSQLFASSTTPHGSTSVILKFAMDEEVQQLVNYLQHNQKQRIEGLEAELQIVHGQLVLKNNDLKKSQRELVEANTEIKQLKEKLNQEVTKPWWKKLFGG